MRLDRFQQLIQHCRQKPGFTKFDFNHVARQIQPDCGTAGCLLGEMAFCWPQEFQLLYCDRETTAGALLLHPDSTLQVDRKRWYTPTESSVAAAAAWFEIPFRDAMWIFMPYEDHDELGLNRLMSDATLDQVLANLERYLSIKSQESCQPSNQPTTPTS